MTDTLHILLIEDSEDDALLLIEAIRLEGYEVRFERVDTHDQVSAALVARQWDAVIADFNLPGYSGLAALKWVKAHDVDLPFLIVSGTIDEVAAVELMRAGAQDYIMKAHLGRLSPAIERELRDAADRRARRQAEKRRKEAEVILLGSERRYRSLVESSPDGIALIDHAGSVLVANSQLAHMLGYDTSVAMTGVSFAHHLPEDERARAAEVWEQRVTGLQSRPQSAKFRILRRDGSSFPAEVRSSLVQGSETDPSVTTATIRDVTEEVAYQEQLQHLALHDTVTNLPNRTLLQDRLQQHLSVARRAGESLAVLVLDLDGLKGVNDTYGRAVGDRVLNEVGTRLTQVLRESDTLARLGEDEFGILLPETNLVGAVQVATKLSQALEQPFDLTGDRIQVGASMGVAFFPDHAEDGERLIRFADVALYAAKQANSGYAVYAVDRDPYSPTRLALSGDLHHAIQSEQLVLHYQPKMQLRTGRIDGMEALVRWKHPAHGLIPPDQFIPLAEHSGLIRPLTTWVIQQAVAQCGLWQKMGFDVGISVNLSAQSVHDPQLPPLIVQTLLANGVSPSQFTVEITESVIMADPERAMETLISFTKTGVKLSIDDFGTGYSSLAYLQHLRGHEVKIDKSFVMDLDTNEENGFIVRSVIELGHNLGLDVVAEGVETQATLNTLTGLACDHAQGYYLSRPVGAAEMTAWLRHRSSSRCIGARAG